MTSVTDLHFSKEALMDLLNHSMAVTLLSGAQRDALNQVLAKANSMQLVQLFVMLKEEKSAMDEIDGDFKEKLMKAVDKHVQKIKTAVVIMKRKKMTKAENKAKKSEKLLEKKLLKELESL